MYAEADKIEKAKEHKHMTFSEAATMAKDANVKELWLTHYSPSLTRPKDFEKEATSIFANTVISKDGQTTDILFED